LSAFFVTLVVGFEHERNASFDFKLNTILLMPIVMVVRLVLLGAKP